MCRFCTFSKMWFFVVLCGLLWFSGIYNFRLSESGSVSTHLYILDIFACFKTCTFLRFPVFRMFHFLTFSRIRFQQDCPDLVIFFNHILSFFCHGFVPKMYYINVLYNILWNYQKYIKNVLCCVLCSEARSALFFEGYKRSWSYKGSAAGGRPCYVLGKSGGGSDLKGVKKGVKFELDLGLDLG